MAKLNSNFWKGRRVLLTGHTGFKGAWLLLWLQELGAEIWGYSLEPEPEPNLFRQLSLERPATFPFNWHHKQGDLASFASLQKLVKESQPEIVFHLAAQPLVRRSYVDPLGTWATNVQGSLHLLESLRILEHHCAVVMVTTDKVYENKEWNSGYRESDRLGGSDPYSASKAAAEIAISSWRTSFVGNLPHQSPHLSIATARSGNVIGGGDWASNRIIPDIVRSLMASQPLVIRNPCATRPWQHVLEPLGGYLMLAEKLWTLQGRVGEAFNFGPRLESNQVVQRLVELSLTHWPGSYIFCSDEAAPHEAGLLHLQFDKAFHELGWSPQWSFEVTVERTMNWYKSVYNGASPLASCLEDLYCYGIA